MLGAKFSSRDEEALLQGGSVVEGRTEWIHRTGRFLGRRVAFISVAPAWLILNHLLLTFQGSQTLIAVLRTAGALAFVLLAVFVALPVIVPNIVTFKRNPDGWKGIWILRATWAGSMLGFYAIMWHVAEINMPISYQDVAVASRSNLRIIDSELVDQDFIDRTDLNSSQIVRSHVENVSFMGANLSGSSLRGSVFVDVSFSQANLCAVDARGADFSQALELETVANWDFFVYDETTKFPDGFLIDHVPGAIIPGREQLLYSCKPGESRLLVLEED